MKQLFIAFGLLLTLTQTAHASAEWPMFKFNSQRHASVNDRPVVTQPRILWKAPVGITGWLNNPVIADQSVFVGSGGYLWDMPDYPDYAKSQSTDGVYAFDLQTGKRKWYTPANNDVNSVVWLDQKVIATGDEGAVWALDSKTGKRLWYTKIKDIGFQLLALDQRVIVGDQSGQLLWLDSKTGKVLVSTQLDGPIRAGAASNGKLIFTATTQGTLYAFDANSGKLKWKQRLQELYPEYVDPAVPLEVYGVPTVVGSQVVFGFSRDTLYDQPALVALDTQNGKLRWKGQQGEEKLDWGNIRTSPAFADHHLIYAEPYSNQIVSLDSSTGSLERVSYAGAPMFPQWSSPAIIDQTAYVPRFDGTISALDITNGDLLWTLYIGQHQLAGQDMPLIWLNEVTDTLWRPNFGDVVYSSPAISQEGQILIPAAGYLYCIGNAE